MTMYEMTIPELERMIKEVENRLDAITFDMGDSYDDDEKAVLDEICALEEQRASLMDQLDTLKGDYPC